MGVRAHLASVEERGPRRLDQLVRGGEVHRQAAPAIHRRAATAGCIHTHFTRACRTQLAASRRSRMKAAFRCPMRTRRRTRDIGRAARGAGGLAAEWRRRGAAPKRSACVGVATHAAPWNPFACERRGRSTRHLEDAGVGAVCEYHLILEESCRSCRTGGALETYLVRQPPEEKACCRGAR